MKTVFAKAKSPTEKKNLLALLKFIVDGTRGAAHCANVPVTMAERIEKLEPGLIKPQAGASADPAGNILMFATPQGIATVYPDAAAADTNVAANAPAASAAPEAEEKKSPFVVEKGFAIPETKRGGIKADVYPFAQMEEGDSFFVPATEDRPNPAKALASTVSSATKRYAAVYPEGHEKAGQPTGKDGRKFTVRARTIADGEKQDGARVYRLRLSNVQQIAA